MSPTIVLEDGKPFIVTGAPGAVKIPDRQSPDDRERDRPRHVDRGGGVGARASTSEGVWVDVEARLYHAIRDGMESRGHSLVKSRLSYDLFFALVHAIKRDAETGRITGAADPRGRGGYAEVR